MFSQKALKSLSRFFYEKPAFPCWVAGRFFDRDSESFFLKSQGLAITCKKNEAFPAQHHFKTDGDTNKPSDFSNKSGISPIKEGAWLAVQLKGYDFQNFCPDKKKRTKEKGRVKNFSKKSRQYLVASCFLLNSPLKTYKKEAFSYHNKGEILQKWDKFLGAVHSFFVQKSLAYVATPSLVRCPGTEAQIQPLKSSFKNYYLATSPEMSLKKLLCQDWTDFFEIKNCYRQEVPNAIQQIEFSLLEWYRAFYSTKELMRECYELLVFVQKQDFCSLEALPKPQFVSVKELFQKHLCFSLSPKSCAQDLKILAQKEGLLAPPNSSFEELFFLLFLNRIESQLPAEKPTFVYDYPPPLRAFAQIQPQGWADRFELYWQGLELANAFYEVIDPGEQKRLFEQHLKQRKDNVPKDKALLKLMEQGMPPVSGIALGLDRLFMILIGKKSLRECRLFPL